MILSVFYFVYFKYTYLTKDWHFESTNNSEINNKRASHPMKMGKGPEQTLDKSR